MKSSINFVFPFLLLLSSCLPTPGGMDSYSQNPNPRLPAINTYQEKVEDCYPDISTPPGTEQAVEVGSTFETKSCEKACYNNYQVLEENHSPESYLSFPIPSYMGVGKCRGHAIVTQQFSMLGRFGKGENPKKCGPDNMSYECQTLYEGIIRDITEGYKVRDIPGFRSLLEFSMNPIIKRSLYSKVINYSHRYSAGYGSVEKKTDGLRKNVFYEIFKRAKNNQKPYVGIRTLTGVDHAILVTKAAYINNQQVLCVSDPLRRKYDPYANDVCDNYIKLDGGFPVYVIGNTSRSLVKFNIYSDDDDRTVKYVDAWKNRCMEQKAASGECRMSSPLK